MKAWLKKLGRFLRWAGLMILDDDVCFFVALNVVGMPLLLGSMEALDLYDPEGIRDFRGCSWWNPAPYFWARNAVLACIFLPMGGLSLLRHRRAEAREGKPYRPLFDVLPIKTWLKKAWSIAVFCKRDLLMWYVLQGVIFALLWFLMYADLMRSIPNYCETSHDPLSIPADWLTWIFTGRK